MAPTVRTRKSIKNQSRKEETPEKVEKKTPGKAEKKTPAKAEKKTPVAKADKKQETPVVGIRKSIRRNSIIASLSITLNSRPRRASTVKEQTPAKIISSSTNLTPKSSKKRKSEDEDESPQNQNKKPKGKNKENQIIEDVEDVYTFNDIDDDADFKCPLPCRDEQYKNILSKLKANIEMSESGCMYISGVPGTGKTAIVMHVLDALKNFEGKKKSSKLQFKSIFINGLMLASPERIWTRIDKELNGNKKSNPQRALENIQLYFKRKPKSHLIIVVDELDQLLDKQQTIMYNFLEWTSQSDSNFSFIAIYNTMSLPENSLMARNISRMGFERVQFAPYNANQLEIIIKNNLNPQKLKGLKDENINLIARKVASISGDVRRAMEIAKRVLEIVEKEGTSGVAAIQKAIKELFSVQCILSLKDCNSIERVFLEALSNEIRKGTTEIASLRSVISNLQLNIEDIKANVDDIIRTCNRLYAKKLILIQRDVRFNLDIGIQLNVSVEDINYAFNYNN